MKIMFGRLAFGRILVKECEYTYCFPQVPKSKVDFMLTYRELNHFGSRVNYVRPFGHFRFGKFYFIVLWENPIYTRPSLREASQLQFGGELLARESSIRVFPCCGYLCKTELKFFEARRNPTSMFW